jgi:hypothetical protein
VPSDEVNFTTTAPDDELWESVGTGRNESQLEKLQDVEILFETHPNGSVSINNGKNK